MKKLVILTTLWVTCIACWVLLWFTERKNIKPAKIILKTESTEEIPSVVQTVHESTGAVDVTVNIDSDTDECININTSDKDRLCLLPGVGPGLAERIVTFRQQYGTFKKTDELLKIKGIGAAKLGQFQNRVCF